MSDVISRGSCPRLPANLTRASKSALIDEVQRLAAELAGFASARDLLAAIVQCAEVPPAASGSGLEYHQVQLDRLAAIKVYGQMALDTGRWDDMTRLTLDTALKPLPYERYSDPEDAAEDAVRPRSASGG